MKDILAVNMFSKSESPFVDHYIREFKKVGASYDVLYFERYNMDYEAAENEIVFKEYCPTGGKKYKKIATMIRYARFIRRIIKKGNYKGIVVLTTNPGIMIFDILLKKYKQKYILDIRDYTNENNKVFYAIEKRILRYSYANVISSKGFMEFLPENEKYFVTHNIPSELKNTPFEKKDLKKEQLTIGFVGSIRYYNENAALINSLKNSEKYVLEYHGTTTNECDLEGYCKKEVINNVIFGGKYYNDDKGKIYSNIDLINSIYGLDGLETTTAIPNRLYDACIYKCPIIVSKGTYLSKVVEENNIGFSIDVFKDNISVELERYIREFDYDSFCNNCKKILDDVNADMENHKNTIRRFVHDVII